MNHKYRFKLQGECKKNGEHFTQLESLESNIIETNNSTSSAPGKPRIVEVTTNAIILDWEPPQINADLITSYKVKWVRKKDRGKMSYTTEEPKFTIEDFIPGLAYYAIVQAICTDNKSKDSVTSDDIVTKLEPLKAPDIKEVTHNTVSLKWDHKQSKGDISYCVFYDSSNDYGRRETNATEVMVNNLTAYMFSVGRKSSLHYDMSPKTEATTHAYKCSEPGIPNAKEITHEHITINWSVPVEHEHVVKFYEIKYKNNNERSFHCENAKSSPMKIERLESEALYRFKIRAHCKSNAIVESEFSDPIATKEAICSKPGKPVKVKLTDNYSKFKAKTRENLEFIQQYIIRMRHELEESDKLRLERVETSVTIDELSPNTDYHFQITAECINKKLVCSPWSDIITTLCSKPEQPQLSKSTYESIIVQWEAPAHGSELVERYTIYCLQGE